MNHLFLSVGNESENQSGNWLLAFLLIIFIALMAFVGALYVCKNNSSEICQVIKNNQWYDFLETKIL